VLISTGEGKVASERSGQILARFIITEDSLALIRLIAIFKAFTSVRGDGADPVIAVAIQWLCAIAILRDCI